MIEELYQNRHLFYACIDIALIPQKLGEDFGVWMGFMLYKDTNQNFLIFVRDRKKSIGKMLLVFLVYETAGLLTQFFPIKLRFHLFGQLYRNQFSGIF